MQKYRPRSMLVTGGAGFIGSHFIRHALSHDQDLSIINLDKLTYAGSLDYLHDLTNNKNYHFVKGDICDNHLIQHLFMHHHIDTVVHFAAESHVDRSISKPEDFVQTNIFGTYNLLECARHHWLDIENLNKEKCRFHHISTDEVYGSLAITDPAFSETTAYQPRSPYSATKAGSDHLVNAYFETYQLPITLSHCSNNYGPCQANEKLIPTIIRACINKKPIPIYGKGKQIRDWLYVEDHCRGIMSIIHNGNCGETYNMGADNEWENIQLANLICDTFDTLLPQERPSKELITYVNDRPGHDFRYAINISKINSELGWSPSISMEAGLKKTIDFYVKQFNEEV